MRKSLAYISVIGFIFGVILFNTNTLSFYGCILIAIAIVSLIIYVVWTIMRVDSDVIPGSGLFE